MVDNNRWKTTVWLPFRYSMSGRITNEVVPTSFAIQMAVQQQKIYKTCWRQLHCRNEWNVVHFKWNVIFPSDILLFELLLFFSLVLPECRPDRCLSNWVCKLIAHLRRSKWGPSSFFTSQPSFVILRMHAHTLLGLHAAGQKRRFVYIDRASEWDFNFAQYVI
jgi:hypothetical protein